MINRIAVIFVGILLAAATGSSAQVIVGLSGGGTYSDFGSPDTPSRWGFTGGGFVGQASSRALALLEVAYTQKGGEGARIDYIETGITGGGFAGPAGGSRARLYGGVTVAFPVSCNAPNAPATAFCDNTNTEWGFPVGITLGKWKHDGGFVGVDARYAVAVTDASLGVYNNTWMFRFVIGRPK
jgi:hypothetical protein